MAGPEARIRVELVYALPDRQWSVSCALPQGATVGDAIRASGWPTQFPEWQIPQLKVGIFGRLQTWDSRLRDGDRVELYRPLQVDPKEVRRRRAAVRTGRKPAAG